MRYRYLLVVLILTSLMLSACDREPRVEIQDRSDFMLNTFVTLHIYDESELGEEKWADIFKSIREIEGLLSKYDENSEVSMINKQAGKDRVEVSKTTYEVLSFAREKSKFVEGAFTPLIGSLTSLWKIGHEDARVPEQAELDEALTKLDLAKLSLSEEGGSYYAKLEEEGMSLDLGAVAKGLAAQMTKVKLRNMGIKRALLDFGGNILILDDKEPAKEWKIGLQSPFAERGEAFMYVVTGAEAVVSSGDYERFSIIDDVKYQHIIDPFTGRPVDNEIRGVSVINEDSTLADIYSTSLMVMGRDRARDFVKDKQIEAVFFYSDGSYESFLNKDRKNGTM